MQILPVLALFLVRTCKIEVLEGEVEHNEASAFALMDMERDEGKTLACCATLLEDTVIEADIDEEPDAEHLPHQKVLPIFHCAY